MIYWLLIITTFIWGMVVGVWCERAHRRRLNKTQSNTYYYINDYSKDDK